MDYLNEMSDFLESFCEAISSIIGMDVTIIDHKFNRVVATGPYKKRSKEVVAHTTFFGKIIERKSPGFIKDVRLEYACKFCEQRNECKEKANLGYPIMFKDKAIGVIGIIAVTEIQRDYLVNNMEMLMVFFQHMSQLLENKIELFSQHKELQEKMKAILKMKEKRITFASIVGEDPQMKALFIMGKHIAKTDSTVLITGESGTGKELFANAIHYDSLRADEPFITVNCAAIPDNLMESELFGYERGAFTGANINGKIGKFEMADKGTLFLDEIGDMSLNMQAKLLRVLQDKKITRIGGVESKKFDVRIICATNRNLSQMVSDKLFRADLFYRIHVIPIQIPSLRERVLDIPILMQYFIDKYVKKFEIKDFVLSNELIDKWSKRCWKGNVRELMHAVEYLVLTGESNCEDEIENEGMIFNGNTLKEVVEDCESKYINKIIKDESIKDKIVLSEKLNISIATLYRKLEKYNIKL